MARIDYEALEDEYGEAPKQEKILHKPKDFERVGSMTDNARIQERNRNGAYKRLETK